MMSKQQEMPSIKEEMINRGRIIVRTSLVGIGVNILLAGFKAAVGFTANSIAVLLDAVNNLSDALSSVITVAGAKLASRKPDKEHPFGHGRIEYLSAMIIAAIVFYAGMTSLWESAKKIIEPEAADYSMLSLIIIAVAVVVKVVLGRYFKRQGAAAESGALEASGADAMFDAILSLSVLASAIIYLVFGISLEAYVGAIIAVFIIKSGIDMMRDTLSDILGERPDPVLVRRIKGMLAAEPEIRGAYDLMINNYGPGRNYASVHIELPDTMNTDEIDRLTRRIHDKVYLETGVRLMGVSVYSYNAHDDEAQNIRKQVYKIVMAHRDYALQVHGFYVDRAQKKMRFDVVVRFGYSLPDIVKELKDEVKAAYPDYEVLIDPDLDMSAVCNNCGHGRTH
ncbi:cation diffusion facilitator family transporter [uncultured Mitsuokella sp.]|uniref:cation diffusion facilitator family transporter n=1 Tax=uncultured Mitsuokella sp. TaxID=453120 RepID=UPI00266F73C7|nr:cation diffusion facilitator family transporter [uncultured Mitsuokella sp.]